MRVTVNLEPEVYRAAKALALAEEATVSGAVNLLLKRALGQKSVVPTGKSSKTAKTRFGFPKVKCDQSITSDAVERLLVEE